MREEGHAKAWIPSVLVCVYIFLLWHMWFKVNFYNRLILIFKPYWILYVCDLHSCLVDDRGGAQTDWWCHALGHFIWPWDIYGTLCCVHIFYYLILYHIWLLNFRLSFCYTNRSWFKIYSFTIKQLQGIWKISVKTFAWHYTMYYICISIKTKYNDNKWNFNQLWAKQQDFG